VIPQALRRRLARTRRRTWIVVLALVLAVLGAGVGVAVAGGEPAITVRSAFVTGTPEAGAKVELDTSLYLPARTPAPAVLLAHGLGGSKADLDSRAKVLARHGFVVLAYSARGFGKSGGLIHLDSPDYEVRDARLLVSHLAALPEVAREDGRPRIAVAGASYGGALALLLAGSDDRIGAVAADITWNDLAQALFPNAAGDKPGVFKKLWAGYLFQAGFAGKLGDPSCGRYAPAVCAAYQHAARTGEPDATLLALLRASSPATVLDRISAPTLIIQGEQDSLFGLDQADANARGIAANGTPVKVIWRSGGHDGGGSGSEVTDALVSWFDQAFAGSVDRSAADRQFLVDQQGAAISSQSGEVVRQTLHVAGYPGIDGTSAQQVRVGVHGLPQTIAAPAGGSPSAVSALPALGGLFGRLAQLGMGTPLARIPGQTAAFRSDPLARSTLIAGAPSARLSVTASGTADATLFLAVRDVAPDGTSTLPSALVAPLRLDGLVPGRPHTVTVRLPAVVASIAAGHRLELTVSTTDLAYALPADARTYTIALADNSAALTIPTVTGRVVHAGNPAAWVYVGAGVAALIAAAVALLLARRRRVAHPDPQLADVPIAITDLVKEYGDGYRAVDGVSFRVEAGQVVGLLGPNGAGKTTTLRVLVGLITPTRGAVHVFGEPVLPGAPVLARLGALIEGPGFLPHLSGLENLRLFWAATGRPDDEADFETALQIAGLGESVHRRVRTYSHGMKQRLGIAQAMLGLPEVLVLDEPTNGLDPPQIAEMREVLASYAATGRTVVVSSHLLAEVEQTCTHVVVMHRGRLVAAGSVAEVAGAGGVQLAVPDPQKATEVLAAAGITAEPVPARRALEDVFLDLVGEGAGEHR
jgi:ABC-2 type transport system ATP-binding protein